MLEWYVDADFSTLVDILYSPDIVPKLAVGKKL